MTEPTSLDPRVNAIRPDLADRRLQGQVEAERFVTPTLARVQVDRAWLFSASGAPPLGKDEPASELLRNEMVLLFEDADGWAWVQAQKDGYVGYVETKSLVPVASCALGPDHQVIQPGCWAYPEPSLKTVPAYALFAGCPVSLVPGGDAPERFVQMTDGYWVPNRALVLLTEPQEPLDPAAMLETAAAFLRTPYLWGGRTVQGLDCSGLVQTVLAIHGLWAPRDSDMQAAELGRDLRTSEQPKAGDLAFFPGHVGLFWDSERLIHANATHMAVTIDLAADVLRSVQADHADAQMRIKRLTD